MRPEWSLGCVDANPERRPKCPARIDELEPAAARERVRRCGHRLERDVVLVLRRENLRVGVARQQFHDDPAAGPRDGEGRALVEQGIAIVEVEFAKSGVEPAEVLFLTGWDPAPVEHEPPHCGDLQPPIRAWKFRQPEIGVKAEAHRDRAVAVGDKRRFQRQVVGAECGHQFEPVAEREDREEAAIGLRKLHALVDLQIIWRPVSGKCGDRRRRLLRAITALFAAIAAIFRRQDELLLSLSLNVPRLFKTGWLKQGAWITGTLRWSMPRTSRTFEGMIPAVETYCGPHFRELTQSRLSGTVSILATCHRSQINSGNTVEMPDGMRLRLAFAQIRRDLGSKMVRPAAHRLIGNHDSAFR